METRLLENQPNIIDQLYCFTLKIFRKNYLLNQTLKNNLRILFQIELRATNTEPMALGGKPKPCLQYAHLGGDY